MNNSLLLGVREDVRFEVSGLGELLVASVERTHVGSVARVDPDVSAQVKVQRESLAAAFERALEGLFTRMHQLMPLQLGALHEGLSALCAHVHPRPVGVQVLTHRRIVPEHFGASLVRTRDGPRHFVGA